MAFISDNLRYHYSGGSSNASAPASLGGVRSSIIVPSQTVQTPPNIGGVTIQSATNNAQGIGILAWASATNAMSWQPPGSLYTYTTSIPSDGTYTLGGSDGWLIVTIVKASLPLTYTIDSLAVSYALSNVFSNVSALNSLVGSVTYRCIYLVNNNGTIGTTAGKVWVGQLTTGPDEIDIGVSATGAGDGVTTGLAVTIANENTAPAGVTFSRPLSYSTGLALPDLAPGQSVGIWQRRTVPENTIGDIAYNTCALSVAVIA